MATEQLSSSNTNSGKEMTSQSQSQDQAPHRPLDRESHAERRVEIEGDLKLKLHLQDWVDEKKQDLLKIESYRDRCNAAKAELYQLMGFYSLFQGVVFSAVSNGSKLTSKTSIFPFLLSLLTCIATAISVHYKLTFYKTEKLKFIRAECDVNNLNDKIKKLKGQGKNFKFEEIDDSKTLSKKKQEEERKVHERFYIAVMFFLVVFSGTILVSCLVVLGFDAKKN